MNTSIDDVWQLIKGGRGTRLDWFGEQPQPQPVAETMTAMANSQGGVILLGVTGAAGTVLGVRNASEAVDTALQAALSIDPPLIIPLPQVFRLNGKPLVMMSIPTGMPHVYALEGRYLHRKGSENALLRSDELRRLIMGRGEASFETEAARGASLADLDWERAR
ncbi:MAG: ATP-binding protein, partial [Anaerolineae bacterium]|nr:ATP-binding protein [Anaerolineae bacterium]